MFNCRRRTCRRKEGSVRALRGVKHTRVEQKGSQTAKESQPTAVGPESARPGLGDSLFRTTSNSTSNKSSANPFAAPASGNTNSNPFSKPHDSLPPLSSLAAKPPQRPSTEDLPETFASKAKISTPSPSPSPSTSPAQAPAAKEPWPPQDAFPPAYPCYYLDADYETLDALPEPAIPTPTIDVDEGGSSNAGGGGGKEDKDAFESTIDRTFQRFADRLAQNPLQVLRYEFRGTPLLYSKTDAVGKRLAPHHGNEGGKVTNSTGGGSGMPNCTSCGAARVFELQLTPQAIAELEVDEMGLEGMEWGTIIVGVCSRDCQASGVGHGAVGYVEEWVGVQWEEVGGKR